MQKKMGLKNLEVASFVTAMNTPRNHTIIGGNDRPRSIQLGVFGTCTAGPCCQ